MTDMFDVDPEPAASGEQLSIVYTNPDKPNEEVTIKMTNGLPDWHAMYEEQTYTGTTDSEGRLGWEPVPTMPDWPTVVLKGPGSNDHPILHA